MGTTADKIAGKIASQLKSKIIDLSGLRAAQQMFQEARIDSDGLKKLMSKEHDPCHALYIFAQNFASVLGEQLSEIKETRQFVKIVSDAEDEFQPGGPPLSPLTVSYFTMWALFDVLFGQSHETIGACILGIGPLIEMPPWLLDVIGQMQRSTMGVYVHCGTDGHLVRLRALGSQETKLCHVPSGYMGQAGELWFVRLLPPANALFDYHIVFNTPYILVDVTERMFADYLAREVGRMGSRNHRTNVRGLPRQRSRTHGVKEPPGKAGGIRLHHEARPDPEPLERIHFLRLYRPPAQRRVPDGHSGYQGEPTTRMTAELFPAVQREQLCLFYVRIRPDISPDVAGLSQSPANLHFLLPAPPPANVP